jgi:hypothetical protein
MHVNAAEIVAESIEATSEPAWQRQEILWLRTHNPGTPHHRWNLQQKKNAPMGLATPQQTTSQSHRILVNI